MGVKITKPKFIELDKKEERNLFKELRLNATRSLSNPSLVTITSDQDLIKLETSPSILFNYEEKVSIYQRYARDNNLSEGAVNSNIVRIAANLNEVLSMDEHILFISTKLWHLLPRHNPDFIASFEAAAAINPNPIFAYTGFDTETKVKIHTMYIMRFEKVLISSYEDGKEEKVSEIFQLLTLSHLLMHIGKEHFEDWTTMKIKFLLHISALTDENKAPYIYFIHMAYLKLCEVIDNYYEKRLCSKSSIDVPEPACRVNYRLMKKWNGLVYNFTRGLSKPIDAIVKQIEESKQLHYVDVNYKEEKMWKIIQLLRKGYRFKHLVNTSEFFHDKPEKGKNKSVYKIKKNERISK